MTVRVFVTTDEDQQVQVGGTWLDVEDAASDINGGNFWSELAILFPNGVKVKEIRLVPDEPF